MCKGLESSWCDLKITLGSGELHPGPLCSCVTVYVVFHNRYPVSAAG